MLKTLRKLLRTLWLLLLATVFIVVTAPEWPAFQDESHQLNALVGQRHFDYLVWEINALQAKGKAALAGGHKYLPSQPRKEVVLAYVALIRESRRLNAEIELLFTDPDLSDPDQASEGLQQELAQVRQELERLQPLAEAVMEEQVADVLVEQGFSLLGRPWPPVSARMTPLPSILVVSPRERIDQISHVSLAPGINVVEQEALESEVFNELDRSALVVPIGGVGLYPSMVLESSDLSWVLETFAHEWAHHWLTLHPLGISYAANPAMRTINETVASLFGDEVGAQVLARYYPELVPPPAPDPGPAEEESPPPDPPPFDFRAEMAATRVEADRLLAAGQVEEAEAYMEARQAFFWDNGYRIRKINQAYFAFYGAYADQPGATGSDPIGPAVNEVRAQSTSLRAFMDEVAGITSLEGLLSLVAGGE
jgi:hypothetical protein